MRLLIIGSNGQLGRCLADQFSGTAHEIIFTNRADLDITDFVGIENKITQLKPDLIINASAYTAVDKAEQDREQAHLVNHQAVGSIAKICARIGCGLIHVSTDYVFDGEASEPYSETDSANPLGVYGDSKFLGELGIVASRCKYMIIRTAWLFSEYGDNFLKAMIQLGAECSELGVVGDQVGCPTYAQDLAHCIVALSYHFERDDFESEILHYCGDESCSWYQFAMIIFSYAGDKGFPTPDNVKHLITEQYKTIAARPAYSVMGCQKIFNKYQIRPSNWRKAVPEILDILKEV